MPPEQPASPERATGPSPRGLKCLDFATEPSRRVEFGRSATLRQECAKLEPQG